MKPSSVIQLIARAAEAINIKDLSNLYAVAKDAVEFLPLTAQEQLEFNARRAFADTSLTLPNNQNSRMTLTNYAVLAMIYIISVERKLPIGSMKFSFTPMSTPLRNEAQGYALTEFLLAHIEMVLEYYALCRMSVHTADTDMDAAVIFTLSGRDQFQDALLAGAQTFMTTTGYDEGFVPDNGAFRIEPEDVIEVNFNDLQVLKKHMRLRHWNNLDECGYDAELINAVKAIG